MSYENFISKMFPALAKQAGLNQELNGIECPRCGRKHAELVKNSCSGCGLALDALSKRLEITPDSRYAGEELPSSDAVPPEQMVDLINAKIENLTLRDTAMNDGFRINPEVEKLKKAKAELLIKLSHAQNETIFERSLREQRGGSPIQDESYITKALNQKPSDLKKTAPVVEEAPITNGFQKAIAKSERNRILEELGKATVDGADISELLRKLF